MEGECSKRSSRIGAFNAEDTSFIDRLFSWSVEDVLNSNLLANQVQKIPESFQSVQHYCESYILPLLEETRTELSTSLETVSSAPFAEVLSFEESKPHGSLLYEVAIDCWRNNSSDKVNGPYRPLPGDVFLVSNAKVDNFSDLRLTKEKFSLAWLPKIPGNADGSTVCKFKIKASKDLSVNGGSHNKLFLAFLINTTSINRIWKSLRFQENVNIIKEVLCTTGEVKKVCDHCSLYNNAIYAERLAKEVSPELNESQRGAILSSLCKIQCCHKSHVELIWGPPGTGKTKTASQLLLTALGMNSRVLICAPTNVAITELASRVLKARTEQIHSRFDEGVVLSLGDLLLFGNNDRLKVSGELRELYLDYRIDKLVTCLGVGNTGWKHCFSSLSVFLQDFVSQYYKFLENESDKEQVSNKEKIYEDGKSLIGFMKERFRSITLPLRRCIKDLCTHLPKSFLLDSNIDKLTLLIQLLKKIETLIFSTVMTSKSQELEEVFSNPTAYPSSVSTLMQVWNQCLSVLLSLNYSLDQLKLPKSLTKYSLRKFCFQKASLIFCTVSTSFQLYSVKMEPISLLVIDEAAQLKESESTIPLKLPGIRHAILIGDEYQLPAIVRSKVSSEAGFGRSLFERLTALGHSKHLLNVQYRMDPLISCFPNSKFYGNKISDAPEVMDRIFKGNYLQEPMFGPYSFINISGDEERDNLSGSWKNMAEIAVLAKILQKLYKAWKGSRKKLTVGIISPYNAQVLAIQEKIGNKYDKLNAFSLKVKSVDGFQGGEEDIIIISTVRSNSSGSIGFVSNDQRTNVALTRARQCLWILGNGRTLHSSGSVWKSVISDAKDRSCFFNADKDMDLGNAIIKVAKGVLQLDDLCIADSLAYKMSRWKTIICEDFVSSFGKLNSVDMKKTVISYLLKLSGGWRPERTGNFGYESSPQIIKCYNVEGFFVVCTTDIETDLKHFQVLKIWNILPPEDIPSFVQWLDGAIKIHTDEFVNYCKQICLEGNLEVPMRWTKSDKLVQFKDIEVCEKERIFDSDTVEGRIYNETVARLSSMRAYPLSCAIVCQLLDPQSVRKLDLQCQEPGHGLESEILLYPRSTFVVGRPSSKKHSILVLKMFNNEKIEIAASTEIAEKSALRQMFVCVTPRTCATVRQYVSQMKRGKDTVIKTASIDVHDVDDAESILNIPYSFDNGSPESYPLVITFWQFLMILDASVGHSFFERFSTLSRLLGIKSRILDTVTLRTLIKTKEVTCERFNLSYWHLFDGQLTKKLDSFIVFIEITFCIKGSLQKGESFDGILSREDYIRLPRGKTTILNRKKKMRIYEIFLQYERRKAEQDEFDLADLTIDILHRLNSKNYEHKQMDFVFVDEVQELSMKQISLFRIICKDLEKGLVFSSDMVDTITSQKGFQFKEIRSLYCREFLPAHTKDGDHKGPASRELSDIFHLNQNAYTSVGVLRLSQSVMDLLFRFFSSSVDILSPEMSCQNHTTGEVPILVTPKEGQNIIMAIFDKNQDDGTNPFSFGAQQVLLVRDNYTRNQIAAVVGEKALVLTIKECQGLEFQDIFLYNFFCSSPLVEEEWRVILEYMKEQGMLEYTPNRSTPTFHPAKHGNLCGELKQLYTAISHARNRLWILENTVELSCPIFDYWKKLSCVHARQLDDSLMVAIQTTSTREEWRYQGIKLYCEGLYDKAEMCFAKARDVLRGRWAKAAGLRAAASHVHAVQSDVARDSIKKATKLFGEIGRPDSVVQCLIEAKEYERAGNFFMKRSRKEDADLCCSLAAFNTCAVEAYPGNLVEAEGTSRMKRRILLEVNSLEGADRYKDASMLILFYVFANSLWASENKGWPLKPFKRKERLLRRAKILAKKDSESLYEIVSLEANILLNQEKSMADLISNFIASDKHKILACSMLSARKIIDIHLKADIEKLEVGHDISLKECSNEMLFPETLCVESLVYFWNFWKQKIVNILQFLVGDRNQDMDESSNCEMSLYKFLGVWNCVSNGGNILMPISSDARWVKKIDGNAYQGNQRFTIGTENFISAAQEFFSSEVVSVSMKVLEYLKTLLVFAIKNSLSLSHYKIITSSCLQIITCLVNVKFQPSLDNEILDNVFDIGLASILNWKQHRGQGHDCELDQKVHAFLAKCILHYHQLKDNRRMMKFARAFPSLDSIRSILEALNRFDDLIVLEVESGNFMEAANIANSQRNFLLEIDLLEKASQHINASTLMLTYVLPHSLWATGSKGWPLMDFGQKKDLLIKAKSFAKNVTEDFFEMTCVEADILSNFQVSLSELKRFLRASQEHKNLRAEILCARKIVDAHLCSEVLSYKWDHELKLDQADQVEETTFENQVSFESLVYFWKLWEGNINSMLGYLRCQVNNGHSTYKEFCLNYFGLRKKLHDQTVSYVLLLPDASWVQHVKSGSFETNKFSINDSQFVFAARSYWSAEILYVGARVLDKLKELYLSSVSLSMSLFRQSIVGIHFFEVANFLMESVFVEPSDTQLLNRILEVKSQFIQDCEPNLTLDFCMGNNGGAVPEVECSLFRNCALHYHNLQDHQRMMTIVKRFHSLGCKRLFLKSLNCLDELLLLEQESGNFLEAAAIARLKGDFLLEIDLLGKCGCFKEASSLILFYVLANSLWSSGKNGWPFKLFKKNKKLLTKAKNFAKNDSDALYNYISAEADVLLGCEFKMCEMNNLLHTSQENVNFTGQILCSRMILDAHLSSNTSEYEWEDLFAVNISEYVKIQSCKNHKSVHTLFYFWNFWSEKVFRIIESLENLDTQCIRDGNYDAEEFCLKYLGVRKELKDGVLVYSLFSSDACWRKNCQNASAQQHDASVTMDATQFVAAATRFWCSELLAVGLMVLKYLNTLRVMSIEKSFSLFSQTISVVHIFEVAKFLSASKIMKSMSDSNELENFVLSSSDCFLGNVFSIKFTTMDENMVALRGTQASREILKEVISRKAASESCFSYEMIGEVVMLMLGSRTLSVELCERVANRFGTNQAWKPFIDNLIKTCPEEQSPEEIVRTIALESSVDKFCVVVKLHEALEITYKARKESACASPTCFLYILERLQILVSEFQGCFYTTKFSLIEWLICKEWSVSTRLPQDMGALHRGTCDFMVQIIKQIVVNKCDTVEWVEKSKIRLEEYYPQLVLRLVILLCLVCINSRKYHEVLYDLLGNTDVRSHLPLEFYNTLQRKRKGDAKFLPNFAKALEKTGNSLVVVNVGDQSLKHARQNVISVRMKDIKCREDAMKILFPDKLKDANDALRLRSAKRRSKRQRVKAENSSNSNEPKQIHRKLWEIFDNLLSVADGKDWKSPKIKVNLPKDLDRVCAVLRWNLQKDKSEGALIEEVNSMLDELEELSAALNLRNSLSDQQLEQNVSQVKELRQKLHSRRLRLEPILDHRPKVDEVQACSSTKSTTAKRCEDKLHKAAKKSTPKMNEGSSHWQRIAKGEQQPDLLNKDGL